MSCCCRSRQQQHMPFTWQTSNSNGRICNRQQQLIPFP
jgi:hypothetical protein